MEIITAEETRQKHNDVILNYIFKCIQNRIDNVDYDFFVKIKKQYITKYVREKIISAGYEIKTNDDSTYFVSWFKKED